MKKVLSLIIIGLLGFSMISILVTQVMAPETTIFSDSFEAATIDPFWTVRQDYGTMALSSDQAHSGSQSLKMSSTGGGQREITLSHSFQGVGKGTISVWLYDTSPETETLYADLNGINSALPPIALPGVPEFEISVTITASVLLCGWLLTQTMVAKWLKTEKRWAKRL